MSNLLSPILLALLFFAHDVAAQPVLRGPSEVQQDSHEVPEWLKDAVQEQARRANDNTAIAIGLVLNIIVSGVGMGTIIFRSGRYVEKVDAHDKTLGHHAEEIVQIWRALGYQYRLNRLGNEKKEDV